MNENKSYLTRAADLIDRVARDNERRHPLDTKRMACARAYMVLAAIDKGLLPEPVATDICKDIYEDFFDGGES